MRAEEGKVGVGHGCTVRPFGPAPKRLFFLGPFDMKMDFWVEKRGKKVFFSEKCFFFLYKGRLIPRFSLFLVGKSVFFRKVTFLGFLVKNPPYTALKK